MKNNCKKIKCWMIVNILGTCIMLTACQDSVLDTDENSSVIDTSNPTEKTVEIAESVKSETEESVSSPEEKNTDDTVYTEPPVMTINYEDQTLTIPAFGYEWNYQVSEEEGLWSGAVADAAHPLDQNFSDRIIHLDPANSVHEISMNFEITPNSIEVLTYWPAPVGADSLPHQSMSAPEEEVNYDSGIPYENTADITDPNVFLAFDGQYIYEIYAMFEADKYHGGAYYTVLITNDSDSVTASVVEE